MNNISTYILEKLVINKNLKLFTYIDKTNFKMIYDLIETTFFIIFRFKTFKINGLATYSIKRSEIPYDKIAELLNTEEYGYNFNIEETSKLHGEFQTIIRKLMPKIESLCNMKKLTLTIGDESKLISGRELYDKYKEYSKKIKNLYEYN